MFKCRHSVTASPGQADTFMQLAGVVWEFPHETAHIKIFFLSNLVIISVKRCCCWVFPNTGYFFQHVEYHKAVLYFHYIQEKRSISAPDPLKNWAARAKTTEMDKLDLHLILR